MQILSRKVIHSTPYLDLIEVDYIKADGESAKWFGVTRNTAAAAVVIAAVTDKNELILVSQLRPMLGDETIELPAGLMDIENEGMLETAKRELLEETGYEARELRILVGGPKGLPVSSGLTDERLYLVLAMGATKVAEPFTNEGTKPILVPLSEAESWLRNIEAEGVNLDYKMFANLALLEKELAR